MEWGCIPLIRRYSDSGYHRNYHDRLLGNHPIPTFEDWNDAAKFAEKLLADESALDALQVEVSNWWQNYKYELQVRVADALANLAI
jgi:hypothetical protein